MSQEEINEQIYDVLTCLVHASDKYNREAIDLNAVALLRKLWRMLPRSKVKCPECGKEHTPDGSFGEFCDSGCYAYHYGDKIRFSIAKANKNG